MENIPPPLSLTLCGEGVLWVRREGVLEVRVGVHVLMSTGAWRCLDQGEHEVVHGTALVCISRRPSRFRARCAAKHSFSDSCTHRHRRALAKLWDLNENFGRQKKSKSPLLYGSVSTNTLIGLNERVQPFTCSTSIFLDMQQSQVIADFVRIVSSAWALMEVQPRAPERGNR